MLTRPLFPFVLSYDQATSACDVVLSDVVVYSHDSSSIHDFQRPIQSRIHHFVVCPSLVIATKHTTNQYFARDKKKRESVKKKKEKEPTLSHNKHWHFPANQEYKVDSSYLASRKHGFI
jgi:hypothetical protein